VENALKQRCLQPWKKGTEKHPWEYSICRCIKKHPFYKNNTLLAAPNIILRKKAHESKTQDFISSDILS